jgi:rSAM/selenodomain-associated transferase 1
MITAFVVAKAPVAGRAKTRLSPPLSSDHAADLQRALLLDTVAGCRAAEADVRLLVTAEEDGPALAALVSDAPIVVQRGRGLADALRFGFADHVAGGPMAVVSSDLPGLPSDALNRAATALDAGADVVLGPACDGGYWLIAMREAHDAPFHDIPWSTPAVWAATLRRCSEAGLRVAVLERWRDIDTYADLAAAWAEVDRDRAPETAAVLDALAAAGVITDGPTPALVSSDLLSISPWRAVVADQLLRPDGRPAEYTYLAVPRAAFVVPVTTDGDVVLVRQYRHPVRDWTLEVPAGSLLEGETPHEAAERELLEETGGRARDWRHLSTFYSSSAHVSLRSDAFLATGVELAEPRPDADELVRPVRMPLADALERAAAGGFAEGQTALAILLAARFLGAELPRAR